MWVVRLVAYLWARIRHRHAGPARWFAVAPAMLVLTVATVSTALPLQIRWWLGRPDFDAVVANAPPTPPAPAEPLTIAVAAPGRVGTYGVRAVAKRRDALLFMERNSNFDYSSLQCGDGGFAYLPGGPFDAREFAALNNPRFSSLGDGWYWFWDPCINP